MIIHDWMYAYFAGVIDSDGYITIWQGRKQNKGRCAPATYHALKVGIAGTDRAVHDLAALVFGGSVQKYIPKASLR